MWIYDFEDLVYLILEDVCGYDFCVGCYMFIIFFINLLLIDFVVFNERIVWLDIVKI